jgi:hypothetical protein
MVQSSHALASSSSTAPAVVARQHSPAKRSPSRDDNWLHALFCSALSTLTPKWVAFPKIGHVVDVWATQTEASGGSNETGVNELAAMPTGLSSMRAAIAITPLGKVPNTCRNRRGSITWAALTPSPCRRAKLKAGTVHQDSPSALLVGGHVVRHTPDCTVALSLDSTIQTTPCTDLVQRCAGCPARGSAPKQAPRAA